MGELTALRAELELVRPIVDRIIGWHAGPRGV